MRRCKIHHTLDMPTPERDFARISQFPLFRSASTLSRRPRSPMGIGPQPAWYPQVRFPSEGPVAQLVEHDTFNVVVVGSSPTRLTTRFLTTLRFVKFTPASR